MIDYIHRLIAFLRKSPQGRYFSPEEIDDAVNNAQIKLFNELLFSFEVNQESTDALEVFKTKVLLPLVSGKASLPADYRKAANHSLVVGGAEVPAKLIPDSNWVDAISSEGCPPTDEYPICRIADGEIEFKTTGDDQAYLYYLRYPVDTEWAYTLNADGRTLDYDAGNSTDTEFPKFLYPRLIEKTLSYLGLAAQEEDLKQYEALRANQDMPIQRP